MGISSMGAPPPTPPTGGQLGAASQRSDDAHSMRTESPSVEPMAQQTTVCCAPTGPHVDVNSEFKAA